MVDSFLGNPEPGRTPTARWSVQLLGDLRAVRASDAVNARFETRKIAGLFAYLAYHPRRAHLREELIDHFWPDADLDQGRISLRTALAALRRRLESPDLPAGSIVIADRQSVRLDPNAFTLDVTVFEAALAAAGRGQTVSERIARLEEAVTIYQGELLPAHYESWILPERARLADANSRALQDLSSALLDVGEWSRAIEHARRAAQADPLDEPARYTLIRAHVAAGQLTAARRQYAELERAMGDELGETPSLALEALLAESRGPGATVEYHREAGVPRGAGRLPRDGETEAPRPIADRRLPPLPRSHRTLRRRPASRATPPEAGAAPPSAPPTGVVTFLFTDIEASTALWERTGDLFRQAQAEHQGLLRQSFREHGGHEFKQVGDGFLVAFTHAADALACAVAGQRALAAHVWPPEVGALRVRMTLYTGDVEYREGDYHGLALHRAQRLLAAAHGGQILCSEGTAALTPRDAVAGVRLLNLGIYRLRDVSTPERLYQVDYVDMAQSRFPPPQADAGHTGNLPLQFTPFFGREAEIEQIRVLLTSPGARLVTLTGLGGTGKTRLAIEVARSIQQDPHGMDACFVALADLADEHLIGDGVRTALGLPTTTDPIGAIVNALADRPCLLVLDNFEQLIPGGAEIVRDLLERVPGVLCLVTSRVALGLQAEWEYTVAPLPTPAAPTTVERLMEFASVRVFISRARAARPGFQLTAENARSVAQLCQALEGLPLALELAAARAQALTPAQMLQHMSDRFGFLVGRHRDVAERHRTLRAVLEWSYQSLSHAHRLLLARLSVFRGGWTVAAAETMTALAPADGSSPTADEPRAAGGHGSLLEMLMDLRDASLLVTEEVAGEMRFRMLETVREYAWERLKENGESEQFRRCHREYFVAFVEEAVSRLEGPEQSAWLERIESEHDNLRAVLEFCAQEPDGGTAGLRLAAPLYLFWDQRGHFTEARARYAVALAHAGAQEPTPARAACLRGAGMICENLSDYYTARALFEEALAIGRALNDPGLTTAALSNLGTVAHALNDDETARRLFEQVLEVSRAQADPFGIARAVSNLGLIAVRAGDDARAQRFFEEGLAIARQMGNRRGIAASLIHLGHLRRRRGEPAGARALFDESLAIRRETNNPWGISAALGGLAMVAREQGSDAAARPLLEEVATITRGLGDRAGLLAATEHLVTIAAAAGNAATARALLAEGIALRRELHERDVGVSLIEAACLVAASEGSWTAAAHLAGAAAERRAAVSLPAFLELDAALLAAHAAAREALGGESFDRSFAEGRTADPEAIGAAVAGQCVGRADRQRPPA